MSTQGTPPGFDPAPTPPTRYTEAQPNTKLSSATFTPIAAPATKVQHAPSPRQ